MTNIVNTGNASVDALAEMNISGNVTPVNWYKTILRENGKPYLLAICVLSEIVYWYRPVEVRDEHSGMTIGYRKKFREDLLQKTYNDFAEQFGESRRSVKAAFDRLEEIGVIRREFRNIETNSGMVLNNVMYIDLCVDRLYTCTYLNIPGDDEDVENTGEEIQKQTENQANKPVTKFCTSSYKTLYDPPTKFCTTPYKTSYDPPAKFCNTLPQNDVPPHTKFCKTNTEKTTENTEEITYPIIPSGTGVKTDTMDRMDEVRSFIKDNIDYDVLLQCHPTEKMDINELVELMVETIAVKQPVIRMADKEVSSLVCATDAGREGELIFRLVYNQAGCKKPFERLWISSMEESAVREGFANLKPGCEYDSLYASALARQKADWLVGINGTRLFTTLYNRLLKVGRVQTPTLAMLVDRESQIMNFKKQAYYQTHILCDGFEAVTDHIDEKGEAEHMADICMGKQAVVSSVVKEQKKVSPPKLYDLTTLQRDANRLFGLTAKQTLEATQNLYEKKLVTYPRTDSQYLSDDMEETARNVIAAIMETVFSKMNVMVNPNIKAVLNSKKVTDHHAIIPTVEIRKAPIEELSANEKSVLTLCANRLLCATGSAYIYDSTKAELRCEDIAFKVSGREVIENGWKDFDGFFRQTYKAAEDKPEKEETKLPELTEGAVMDVTETKVTEHFTTPPKHFTEDSLLSAMEKAGASEMDDEVERKGLGTPATRADVIEKLVKDGFVKREKKQMIPTDDGIKLITILPDVVKSPQLTADWENELVKVARGETSADDFMCGITDMVSDLVSSYSSVTEENKGMFRKDQEEFGKCPKCGKSVVKGKFGPYCTGKCGMGFAKAFGVTLTDNQVKNLLEGKKILVKGITNKAGKVYDAYLTPNGTTSYSYTDAKGNTRSGFQYSFNMEFPSKKK